MAKKIKNDNNKVERELEYAKLMYSALREHNDKLMKSLIYLQWNIEQKIKMYDKPIIKGYNKSKEHKYHIEQTKLLLNGIKKEISDEISKYFNGYLSKAFEYVDMENSLCSGFNGGFCGD